MSLAHELNNLLWSGPPFVLAAAVDLSSGSVIQEAPPSADSRQHGQALFFLIDDLFRQGSELERLVEELTDSEASDGFSELVVHASEGILVFVGQRSMRTGLIALLKPDALLGQALVELRRCARVLVSDPEAQS